ncbi:hypothetical protein PMAYCL1PPCAC_08255, partial [Pristionchus mayeri]
RLVPLSCRFSSSYFITNSFEMSPSKIFDENWEPGPPWRVVAATDVYEKKFKILDVEFEGGENDKYGGVKAFSMPIVLTVCLVVAILVSLLIFFIRRACFPVYEAVHENTLVEEPEKKIDESDESLHREGILNM